MIILEVQETGRNVRKADFIYDASRQLALLTNTV